MNINFITPLYRYDNIPTIYENINSITSNFNWYLIEGSNKIGDTDVSHILKDSRVVYHKINTQQIWGHEQRNFFIKNIECVSDDWCYFLDDDNLITQDIIDVINDKDNSNADIILMSQKMGNTDQTRLYGLLGHLSLGNCDIGSFLIKYKIIKNTYIYNEDQRNADGHYCEQLNSINNINIKYLLNKFTKYNALSDKIL
jgi:hypothetical protein